MVFLINWNFEEDSKTVFSKNQGLAQIKIVVKINESKKENTSQKIGAIKTKKKKKIPTKKQEFDKGAVQSAGKDELYASYLKEVRDVILKNRYMSRIAQKMKLKGETKVSFTIEKPNIISNLEVLKSSGYEALDYSALETIKTIQDVPVIPGGLSKNKINITLSVVYE